MLNQEPSKRPTIDEIQEKLINDTPAAQRLKWIQLENKQDLD